MGVIDFVPSCGSEPVMDAVCTAMVGSGRTGRALDAGFGREDESSNVFCAGETRQSFCENKWMTMACTLVICIIQHERLISVDIVPHRNKNIETYQMKINNINLK